MTFKELFFKGEIPFDEIDRYTSRWNFSDETCTVAHYLGLNDEEEDVWISQSDEALEELLEKEKTAYASCRTKIIFTDLDGTLLNDDKKVSDTNKEAIRKALDAGHKIVLASGRALDHVIPVADSLELKKPGCYIIAYNGGQIYDCYAKRLLLHVHLTFEDVDAVISEAKKAGLYYQTYQDGRVIAPYDCEELRFYSKWTSAPFSVVDDVYDSLLSEPGKVLYIDLKDRSRLEAFKDLLNERFSDRMDALFTSDYYLESIPKGVSKGNAVHFLANYLNIPMDNTIAVGDYDNDLPMIREAAVGVILANGPEHVKKEADHVTDNDNNHDGFAEAVYKFVLI